MAGEKHSFLTTLPGILTGIAAIVTAGASAYTLYTRSREPVASEPQPSPSAAFAQPEGINSPAASSPAVKPSASPAPAVGGPFSSTAVINDPDGYVNVRAGTSTQSRIVATVRLNETIRTHPQAGAWWLVRTRDGAQGYIHASRIRMING